MTQEDFEAITALPEVKSGRVHIELAHLGFKLIARRVVHGRIQEVEQTITYFEAWEARSPVAIFKAMIDALLEALTAKA